MFNSASTTEPVSLLDRLSRSSPRVLVVGDAILDQFVYGQARRISPEAPVPVVHATHERYFPGGAANVMANLAAFGADVQGLAVAGLDADAARLKELLGAYGVSTEHFVAQPDWSTPRKCRVVAEKQHALRIDFERPCRIDSRTFAALAGAAQQLIPDCDAVVVSDYAKGTLSPLLIQSIVALARDLGRPVIVDPKGCDASRYTSATVLTPNQAETEALTGVSIHDEESLAHAAGALRQSAAADWIVVTRGEQGMAVLGDDWTLIPARAACAQDVSGAGDTVVAATAFALATGLTVPEAATIANAAASVAVARPGIATLSRAELLAAAAGSEAPPSIVVTRHEMRQQVSRLRRMGRRIVFTNGCFDVIHRGHLEYLEQSRALGDVLIVGLNCDDSVRRLKGPGRPVNGETDRARVLAGLRCVDYVVLFEEDTPYELIQELRPDVLTKGGDYDRDAVVGHDLVAETHVLGLVPGRSTSSLIHAIRNESRGRSDPVDARDGAARREGRQTTTYQPAFAHAPA